MTSQGAARGRFQRAVDRRRIDHQKTLAADAGYAGVGRFRPG
jgi:hypothetical protein